MTVNPKLLEPIHSSLERNLINCVAHVHYISTSVIFFSLSAQYLHLSSLLVHEHPMVFERFLARIKSIMVCAIVIVVKSFTRFGGQSGLKAFSMKS